VFHPDHSCREAVARLIAFLVGQGQRPCAAGTGAYCEARQRLPERLLLYNANSFPIRIAEFL
jgi:hypothetical protein